MEHKYMTFEEIVELSREINRKMLEAKKANLTENEERQFAEEMSKKSIELSAQLACYINNEVVSELTITNQSIPFIAAALMFVWEGILNLEKADPGCKRVCMAMKGMLHRRLGMQATSVNLSAILRGDKD